MSLITDIKKLRELEQQATGGKWETEENDTGHEIRMGKAITCRGQYPCHQVIEYEHGCFEDDENDPPANAQAAEAEANAYLISNLRNLAPAMLRVLECFRERDAERLERAAERLRVEAIGWREEDFRAAKEDIAAYRRLRAAAALMEHVISGWEIYEEKEEKEEQ